MIDIRKQMNEIDEKYEFEPYYDNEFWHIEADDLLCEVLRQYGENELVEWFENHDKWYS